MEHSHKICEACGSKQFKKYLSTADHFLSGESFELLMCINCELLKTNPLPDNLSDYYKSSNYVSHSENRNGLINKLYFLIRELNFKIKHSLISKYKSSGNVLDYGSGSGEFVKYLNSKNFTALGYEPNEEVRLVANKNKDVKILGESDLENLSIKQDIITLWHVLEHVPNPAEVLSFLFNLAAEDGILIIAVPNYKSFDAAYYKQYWAGYDVPRHLFHYSSTSISSITEKTGWKLIDIKGMIFDSFYVSMLSEKYKKRFVVFGLFIGLLSNVMAFLNKKNYSSKMYIYVKNTTA